MPFINTARLTKNYSHIGIEDLNVKGMMQNRRLSRSIADMSFYEFRRQMEYKSRIRNKKISDLLDDNFKHIKLTIKGNIMKIKDLHTLLLYGNQIKEGACPVTKKLGQFTKNIEEKYTNKNYQLTIIQKFQLINHLDLFYEDEDTPPWCRYPFQQTEKIVNCLRNFIIEEIYSDKKLKYDKERMLRSLTVLREKQLFTEEIFKIIHDNGKFAIDIINAYITLNSANMLKDPENLRIIISSFKYMDEQNIFNVLQGMRELSRVNVLQKYFLPLLMHAKHAIQLAEGIEALTKAKINSEENVSTIIKNAEHSNFLAWGMAALEEKGINSEENRSMLIAKPFESFSLAKAYCTLHSNDEKQNLLTQKNRLILSKNSEIFYIQHMLESLKNSNILTQPNFNLLIKVSKQALGLNLWWLKLKESGTNTQYNYEQLCRFAVVFNHESVRNVERDLLTEFYAYPEVEHWVVKLTQFRFNHVLTICKKFNGNIEKSAQEVAKYLNTLIKAQRDMTVQKSSSYAWMATAIPFSLNQKVNEEKLSISTSDVSVNSPTHLTLQDSLSPAQSSENEFISLRTNSM